MMRITRLVASLVLCGASAAHAATSEIADAAMRGDREAVRAALARKADVNAAQVDGTTALHWAVERDDVELAEVLLTAGARVSARTREGVTPLQLAAINGSAGMLGRLIKSGADPNAPLTPARDTALMVAARTGKTDAIRLLLEAGADINAQEIWGGTTALMWAVAGGHAEAANLGRFCSRLVVWGLDREHRFDVSRGQGFQAGCSISEAKVTQ